jgi:hypothetical protein
VKIFVIIYGLLGLVPVTEKPGDIMVLLVDTSGMHMSDGMPAMRHYPEIGLYKADAKKNSAPDQIIGLAGDDIEILNILPGDLDIPKPSTNGTERILRFDNVLGTIGLKPRAASGCLGDQPASKCKHGNYPLLSGRLEMKGRVLVRPIELTPNKLLKRLMPNELPKVEIATQWGFRSVDTGQKLGVANPYSSGILLVADVPQDKLPAKLHLRQGDDFTLSAAGTKTCALLWKVAGLANPVTQCAMVMLTNAPFPQDAYKDVEVDHTELLYPLFENGTGHMLRAYRYRSIATSGPGNGQGNHCVGGIIRP